MDNSSLKKRFGWQQRPSAHNNLISDCPESQEAIKRLITVIDDDVIEINNYNNGRCWKWLVICLLFFIVIFFFESSFSSPYSKGDKKSISFIIPNEISVLINPQRYGESVANHLENKFFEGQRFEDKKREELIKETIKSALEEWYIGVVMLLMIFIPLSIWLLPSHKGIRIDRKRKMIYTWSRGRFYCQQVTRADLRDIPVYQQKAGYVFLDNAQHGALVIGLNQYDNVNETKAFFLGRAPSTYLSQPQLIQEIIHDHLFSPKSPQWLVRIKTQPKDKQQWLDWLAWLGQFSLFKTSWSASTNKHADQHLAQKAQVDSDDPKAAKKRAQQFSREESNLTPINRLHKGSRWFVMSSVITLCLLGVAGYYITQSYYEFRVGDQVGMLSRGLIALGLLKVMFSAR